MVKSNNHAYIYTRFPYRHLAQLWFCMVTITPEFRLSWRVLATRLSHSSRSFLNSTFSASGAQTVIEVGDE